MVVGISLLAYVDYEADHALSRVAAVLLGIWIGSIICNFVLDS